MKGGEHFGHLEVECLDDIQVNPMEMWPTTMEMDPCGSEGDATINSEDVEFLNFCKNLNYKIDSTSWSCVNEADRWVLFMSFLPL